MNGLHYPRCTSRVDEFPHYLATPEVPFRLPRAEAGGYRSAAYSCRARFRIGTSASPFLQSLRKSA